MPTAAAGKDRESADVLEFWRRVEAAGAIGLSYVVLLGVRSIDPSNLLERIQAGLPYQAWERLMRNTQLEKEELLQFVQIPARTLSRRKEEGRLLADESDRLLRASRIFAAALALFEGRADAARRWLRTSQPGLGGATPLEYGASEFGAREVEALIGRLEHGIPV